jgi:hypothetical protein
MGNQLNNFNIVTDLESNIYVHTNQKNLEGTYRICDCSFCREETSNFFETSLDKDVGLKSKPPEYMPRHYPKPRISSNKVGFRTTSLMVPWGVFPR